MAKTVPAGSRELPAYKHRGPIHLINTVRHSVHPNGEIVQANAAVLLGINVGPEVLNTAQH